MIFHSFIHGDGEENPKESLFRSNVSKFVNDTTTHPIIKYQAFIIAAIMIVAGLFILLLFNSERIFGHSFWKHLFVPISSNRRDEYMSDAEIFRKAIEGMATASSKGGKTMNKSGAFDSANKDEKETAKKLPCGTDCGQYIEIKGKINELTKYVNAMKEQKESIKQTEEKLQELGKQIEDLNKSLSPDGQLNIDIQ
jgi:hypothetical protein